MKKFCVSIFIFISLIVKGQFFCLTPEINKRAELLNPEALSAKAFLNNYTKKFEKEYQKDKTIIIIPVVFHVVHNYGPENISKEQILDAIRIINEDFRKLNADTSNIIPEFKSIAADCQIEFRLAKIDPNGNCTDGINRVVSPLTYNANEMTKLAAPSWDRTKYLNIWTVASIESGAAGYAYYPSSVNGSWGDAFDGVLILSNYVGSIGTGTYNRARALTHEIGHYLNLKHPWGDSNNPGLPENCYDDDDVTDTPNTIGHTDCNLYAESCGSLDNVQNYMEYTYCYCMFTEGQKIRMLAALNSPISGRNNLWTTTNLMATGVHPGVTPQICSPIADFYFSKKFGCEGTTVQFTNQTWNTDTISSIQWLFPGGNPATSNEPNPLVTYTQGGIYSATLIVENPAGSDAITKNNIIQIMNSSVAYNLPWFESFENTNFPQSADTNFIWYTSGTGAYNWYRTTQASATGNASLVAPTHQNANNSQIEIYSPNIFISGQNPANIIKFKVAYAQKNENSNDNLKVFVSFNCGETWYPRYSKSGVNLQTTNGTYYYNFVPTSTQWREDFFSIGTFLSKPFIRLKIVATSSDGNPIYIDDIQLDKSTTYLQETFENTYMPMVYPNPIIEESRLWLNMPSKENVNICINDVAGREVYNSTLLLLEGENSINLSLSDKLNAGIYFMTINIKQQKQVIKLIVP